MARHMRGCPKLQLQEDDPVESKDRASIPPPEELEHIADNEVIADYKQERPDPGEEPQQSRLITSYY